MTPDLIGLLLLAGGMLGALVWLVRLGGDRQRAADASHETKSIETAHAVERDVDALSDAAAADELRADWSRKD